MVEENFNSSALLKLQQATDELIEASRKNHRFDKTAPSLEMERGLGLGTYSTKEPVNRFIEL